MKIFVAVAVLFGAAPVMAAEAETAAVPVAQTAAQGVAATAAVRVKPAKISKICREPAMKTGSRMGSGRQCKSASEWAELDAAKKDTNVEASQLGNVSRAN